MAAARCLDKVPENDKKIWDATLGLGGHAAALAAAFPGARLLVSDADPEMLALARARLGERITYAQANFSEDPFAREAPFGFVLLDLGISSAHYDFFERGFSFRFDQPLDMRMDTTLTNSAADILAKYEEAELARIFFEYGEEKQSRRIAHEIILRRKESPVKTTAQLVAVCQKFYPPKYRAKGHADRNPATRVFQALRIAVNDELGALRNALGFLPDRLCVGGRLAIITFHSLEDRVVKLAFKARSEIRQTDPHARSNFLPGNFVQVEPGGVVPSAVEISTNPRARSARLRVLERVK